MFRVFKIERGVFFLRSARPFSKRNRTKQKTKGKKFWFNIII